ncbi:hypothetical protein P775_14340 [Puniceibacterium antarcticum]|uniref:Uncharacterized protein n=1 Tax=Puniceibacterium antarcticum TaxID=1206336 RepID=A0A2G8RCV6_9RHOB|nr:hypothetical protein P775_14340 [Puniceibacterium antarcticum]
MDQTMIGSGLVIGTSFKPHAHALVISDFGPPTKRFDRVGHTPCVADSCLISSDQLIANKR